MNWRQYNWLAGCLAVFFTVVILFAGQLLWQKFAVADPLSTAFSNINGVVETTWDKQSKNGESMRIYVTLQNVENLAKTYEELNDKARQVLGKKPFRIIICDNRSSELEQFNYKTQYIVQQAIFTGDFSLMVEHLVARAQEDNIDIQIYVDTENVYLQTKKETAQMFVVIPRRVENQEVK